MKKLSGFSLMEMMVVLLIVSIVAAASAPMINKRMIIAASDKSPWVWVGANHSIAYNLGGSSAQTASIGTILAPANAENARLYIKSGDSTPQIALGQDDTNIIKLLAGNTSVFLTDDITNFNSSRSQTVLGYGAKVSDSANGTVAIGSNATASDTSSTAIGTSAKATAPTSTALGSSAQASGAGSTALGRSAKASGGSSTALGSDAIASRYGSTALGLYAQASGDYSAALGYYPSASGNNSVSLGYNAKTRGNNSASLGYNAKTSGNNSVALGSGAVTSTTNQIVLGTVNDTVVIPGVFEVQNLRVTGDFVVEGNTLLGGNSGSKTFIREGHSSWRRICLMNDSFKNVDLQGSGSIRAFSSTLHPSITILNKTYKGQHDGADDTEGDNFDTSNTSDTSDRRLKNVGKVFEGGLAEIKKLEVFNYTFKADESKTPRVGVMAQDLQKIFPNAVTKGEDGFLRIRMEDMFYALVNAVKELSNKFDTYDKQIAELTKQNQDIVKQNQKIVKQNQELQKTVTTLEKRLVELEKKVNAEK